MKCVIAKNKAFETRISSRSGGVFPSIANHILEQRGVVYGAVLVGNSCVEHYRATDLESIKRISGSKYLQSHINETYCDVKRDLESGRFVLFSGTPCQVKGLHCYLNGGANHYENLITVDIFCHGVPSEIIWRKYIQYIEKNNKKEVSTVDFRNKYKYGWMKHVETFYFEDGTSLDSEQFKKMFLGMEMLRPSCFNCKYKNLDRVGDISLGDAWGIESKGFESFDDNGESIVLINTEIGEQLFTKLNDLVYFECDVNDYIQPALSYNYVAPSSRKKFWKTYQKKTFSQFVSWYNKHTYLINSLNRIKEIFGIKQKIR